MYSFLLSASLIAPPQTGIEPPPFFVAEAVAEKRQSGRLVRLSPDFTATLAEDSNERTVKGVLSLRRSDKAIPPPPTGPQLITATGDRIVGTVTGGDGQSLRFTPDFLARQKPEPWKVPLSSAAVLWLTTSPADTPLDVARYDWLEGGRNRDVVRLRNGDVGRGTLEGVGGDESGPVFGFRPDKGSARTLRGEDVSAIGFNPSLARTRKPKGPYVQVVLVDASRLSLTNSSVSNGILSGETVFGVKATIPLKDVLGLNVYQGKATYLSDLKSRKMEQAGFLGVAWPWAADRSVQGQALRLTTNVGLSHFEKGLGTHPRTALTYDLGGKYKRFEALVGLDPHANVRGQATVRVLLDGKEQTVNGLPTVGTGKAVPVEVNVTAAKELVLITDFGPSGGVGADVNWCDARVVE